MTDKKCPNCGLWNLNSAMICDCGYRFLVDGKQVSRKRILGKKDGLILWGILGVFALIIVIAALDFPEMESVTFWIPLIFPVFFCWAGWRIGSLIDKGSRNAAIVLSYFGAACGLIFFVISAIGGGFG